MNSMGVVDGEEKGEKWSQFLVVFIATIAVFTSGLHMGWPAPFLPELLSDTFPFRISNEEASYITIIGSFGNFMGSFVGYFILDIIGRQKTILLIALPQLISFISLALSHLLMPLLYIGRITGGMGEGMIVTIVILYIGEIAEPSIRGTLCTLVSITMYLGVLFVNIVGSFSTIKITSFCFIPLPIIFLVFFWKMPESPYFLLMKNKEDEARKSLRFLRRKYNVEEELRKLNEDVRRQMSERGTLMDIFKIDSNRRAFLITIGARFFQLSTGVAAFNLYLQLLLRESTGTLPPQISSSIILLIQLVMTVVSTFIVDKLGRKPLLLLSTAGCCINLTILTIYFILKHHSIIESDWLPLVLMMIHIVLHSVGLGVIVSVLTSEMFSASIKSKLICLVNAAYAIGTLVFTKYYQTTADGFGLAVPFGSFAILTFLGILFFIFFVPETKGKSLEQIQQQLKGKRV